MYKQTVPERIKQLRTLMLIHSYIYYKLHSNIVSDDLWQMWANELRDMQKEHGEEWGWYDEDFKNWSGDTGMHLTFDSWVISKSHYVIAVNKKMMENKQ
ncbi:MAG: hypothetical protein DRQ78_07880 [Epsilonproteobacteria bacterium]|nr:MAG: hypothetical protein DRQ78_07880 [Campylobacterota bacterium]